MRFTTRALPLIALIAIVATGAYHLGVYTEKRTPEPELAKEFYEFFAPDAKAPTAEEAIRIDAEVRDKYALKKQNHLYRDIRVQIHGAEPFGYGCEVTIYHPSTAYTPIDQFELIDFIDSRISHYISQRPQITPEPINFPMITTRRLEKSNQR